MTLFWNSQTNHLFLTVEDERLGGSFELQVRAADALDSFRHPMPTPAVAAPTLYSLHERS